MRNIASVLINESQDWQRDIKELVKRIVFNTLIGNADMHLKNWSLIYYDRVNPSLAPAYDFVSTIAYLPDFSAALKLSRSIKFSDVTWDELKHFSNKLRIPERIVIDTAKETLDLFYQHWHLDKKNLMLSNSLIDRIENHLKTVPLMY